MVQRETDQNVTWRTKPNRISKLSWHCDVKSVQVFIRTPTGSLLSGNQQTMSQLYAAALFGAIILVAADLLGRIIIFPWQVPAGLLSALIGGPYFLTMMWKKSHG
ncbi:iron chelate uptake ABC transporter family permease subunit [Brucella pituitosa]|uniref:iron chelate uptake ABC transporter family permease subunit n=1 Tax=Brucella pituitosa TaxID=571256 RepID=UPI003C7553F7